MLFLIRYWHRIRNTLLCRWKRVLLAIRPAQQSIGLGLARKWRCNRVTKTCHYQLISAFEEKTQELQSIERKQVRAANYVFILHNPFCPNEHLEFTQPSVPDEVNSKTLCCWNSSLPVSRQIFMIWSQTCHAFSLKQFFFFRSNRFTSP